MKRIKRNQNKYIMGYIQIPKPQTPEEKIAFLNEAFDRLRTFMMNNIDHVDIFLEMKHNPTMMSVNPPMFIEGDREHIIRVAESRPIPFYIERSQTKSNETKAIEKV